MLRRHRDLAWQKVGAEAVLMKLPEGPAMGLNPTGTLLWSLLEERDEDGLVRALVEQFKTDEAGAREDVRGFLAMLRERGLVSEA